jgi:oligopeptide/dipeptide ABC transporter ATP-binding protein
MSASTVLEIQNLNVHFSLFRGESRVLNDVNLTVREAETVALVGETGCGKSLTAKAILRILPSPPAQIDSGKILFMGRDLMELDETEMQLIRGKEIAVIPQDPMTALNPVFTIEDQIITMMIWQGRQKVSFREMLELRRDKALKKELLAKVFPILNSLRIPSPELLLNRYPIELSGGTNQRILIAMALLRNVKFLIADEPGTGLDVTTHAKILDMLRGRIKSGLISTLYITHDLAIASKIADRIAVMYGGTIVEVGRARNIFEAPTHPYTIALIKSLPKLKEGIGEGIPGMIPDYVHPPAGCRFHPRCAHSMDLCSHEKPEITEVEKDHFVACYLCGRGA